MSTPKKALLVTTVSGFVPQFEMNNVRILQEMGYEIHYASNFHTPSYGNDNHRLDGTGIIRHQIDFVRNPFRLSNLHVYRSLKALMESEHFDLVHCHTPMGGVMARLAAHATRTAPVIYTAHGFHFFKGASPIYWICYYPVEKFLSRFTTQQLCLNQEDYLRARKHFHARYVDHIPGVGIDLRRIPRMTPEQAACKKSELGLENGAFILLSTGELIRRKNHETILRALARMKQAAESGGKPLPRFQYIICGHGRLEKYLRRLTRKLGLDSLVRFAGYREDIMEIYQIADLFLFPSYQEGLPMAMLEAMASGLPVICSNIRGNADLMERCGASTAPLIRCRGGIMIQGADNINAYSQAISQMLRRPEKLTQMGACNARRVEHFSIAQVSAIMESIYKRCLNQ